MIGSKNLHTCIVCPPEGTGITLLAVKSLYVSPNNSESVSPCFVPLLQSVQTMYVLSDLSIVVQVFLGHIIAFFQ